MRDKSLRNLLKEPSLADQAPPSRMQLVELSRKGIRKEALDNLASTLGVTMKEFAKLLPVTERTLQRRKPGSLLSKAVSEHAILISEVIAKGLDVFGGEATFQQWVQEANMTLGGNTPFSLLDTAIGAQMVQEELNKLEYGVYS